MASTFKIFFTKPNSRGWVRFFLFLVSLTCCSGAIYAENTGKVYQLGHGYRLGETGIQLGGYASLGAQGFGSSPWSAGTNDLSLFVSWDDGGKMSFFSELEVEHAFRVGQNQGLTTDNAEFLVERLYADYKLNDSLAIRLGKFLTPVGQWNLIHADPLVWTTTRPVATDNLFAEHSTGLMLHGALPIGEHYLDYAIYGDYSSALELKKADSPYFDNALGLRLRFDLTNNVLLGLSYVDFALTENPNVRNHLVGLDIAWDYQGYSVMSEIVYRNNDAQQNNQAWQGYFQGVVPTHILDNVYAIGRYEFFDQANNRFGQVGVFGLAYRPLPPLTFKLEYRLGENNRNLAPNGLFTSLAILF